MQDEPSPGGCHFPGSGPGAARPAGGSRRSGSGGTSPKLTGAPDLRASLSSGGCGGGERVRAIVVGGGMAGLGVALALSREAEGATQVSPLRVRASQPTEGETARRDGILLHCSVGAKVTHSCAQPGAEVGEAVNIALARKLLAALGWLIDLDQVNGERRLAIFVPLSSAPELTTSVALS